jgi:hypothetical protein
MYYYYSMDEHSINKHSINKLKDIPEAKYVMDDLMDRTYKSEQQLTQYKKDSIVLIHKIIRDISMLQLQSTGLYGLDKEQLTKKSDAMSNLIKLIELNIT